jgi:hypothetical protein
MDSDPDTEWSAPDGQTTGTLEFTFAHPRKIHWVELQETARPTLIQTYEVSSWDGTKWVHLVTRDGPAFYYKAEFSPITTQKLRVQILKSKGTAAVFEVVIGEVED